MTPGITPSTMSYNMVHRAHMRHGLVVIITRPWVVTTWEEKYINGEKNSVVVTYMNNSMYVKHTLKPAPAHCDQTSELQLKYSLKTPSKYDEIVQPS